MTDPKKKEPLGLYILAGAAVVALDQLSKAWVRAHIPLYPSAAERLPLIPGVVHLSHIRNAGVAFGLFQGGRWVFLGLLAAFCALVIWAIAAGKLTAPWEKWLGVLAMAGALGNGIDRALFGYVTDMLELEFMDFPVFNLADCVINVSCVLFIALTLLKKEEKSDKERT